MTTELFDALRAADADTPAAIDTFDRVVAPAAPLPDFYEYSLRSTGAGSPCRLTYYFDVHRHGVEVAREAGARFVELSRQMALPLPPQLSAFMQSEARAAADVQQVVVGIEAHRDGAEDRAKYYLVFRDDPATCVLELLRMLGLETPPGMDPARAYILAVDVTRQGVSDVKVYFRLEQTLAPRLIENLNEVSDLLATSRDVVLQQCIQRPERRQLYLDTGHGAFLSEWLARHGFAGPLDRAGAVTSKLQRGRLDPRIVSFPYVRRRLLVQAGTVYFHKS
jgi:hypothetical protein